MALNAIKSRLFSQVDASFLTVFRIGFGIILLWEVFRYWNYGWIESMFIAPEFFFKYYGFEWVQPWPGDGMYYHFIVLGILAVCIGIGLFYRLSTVLFFLAFSFVFLQDQALYLNHFYMVILLAFLLMLVPAHRQFSVDALVRPSIRSTTSTLWTLWILRAQMEVIYLYAGIVKINPDWLQLEPLGTWLSYREALPLLGSIYTQDWAIAIASYGVIILHVVGAPLLLWKKTRLVMFIIYTAFHVLNHFTFRIGIFPWMTILATTVFFDPDWPKKLWRKIKSLLRLQPVSPQAGSTLAPASHSAGSMHVGSPLAQNFILIFIGVWLAFQVLMPSRHLLYPGNVNWTEEGHRFSWRMKLRSKQGVADFIVYDPHSGKLWYVKPEQFLDDDQAWKMASQPDMILQFAHFLAEKWKNDHQLADVQVRVQNYVSLNYRRHAPMVDPHRDLTKIERNLRPADWILPLHEPLHRNEIETGNSDKLHRTDG